MTTKFGTDETYATIAFLSIFLATLHNFYFAHIGGSILSVAALSVLLSAVIIVAAMNGVHSVAVPVRHLWVSIAFSGAAIASALALPFSNDLKAAIGLSTGALSLALCGMLFRNRWGAFLIGLRLVIVVHLAFLALQVAWYYATGHYLDYVSISDHQSAWESSKAYVIAGHQIPRFTGLFEEPGNLAGHLGALAATRYLLERRADSLFFIVVAVLFATAALTGMIMGAGLVAGLAYDMLRLGKHRSAVIMAGGIVLAAMLAFMAYRFQYRVASTTGSLPDDISVQVLLWVVDIKDASLFGHGLADLPEYLDFGYFGIWMSMLVQFGTVGFLALVGAMAPAAMANAPLAAVILLSKLKVTYPLAFILIAALLYMPRPKPKRS